MSDAPLDVDSIADAIPPIPADAVISGSPLSSTIVAEPPSHVLTIVAVVVVIAIILLAVAILIFFLVGNNPPTHAITIQNGTSQSLTLNLLALSTVVLAPNASHTVNIQLGQNFEVQAFYTADGLFENDYGTQVIVNLADSLTLTDRYAVSVQNGFNLGATIMPTANFTQNTKDIYSCQSPSWKFLPGVTGIGLRDCPPNLQFHTDGFQFCISPCTLSNSTPPPNPDSVAYCCTAPDSCTNNNCQETWPHNIDYWSLMNSACPTCLITNCEVPNYYCQNTNATTPIPYLIRFIDTI